MAKDKRYLNIKNQFLSGHIKTFDDIFINEIHKKSVIARDLGMPVDRLDTKMEDVRKFNVGHLTRFAMLTDLELIQVMQLVANQYKRQIKK